MSFITKTKQLFLQLKNGTHQFWEHQKKYELLTNTNKRLNRFEFRFCKQHEKDIQTLIPFLMISFLMPELLLVYMFKAPIPKPFQTIQQYQQLITKRNEKRLNHVYHDKPLSFYTWKELQEINDYFGLYKYRFPSRLRTQLQQHFDYLSKDDEYIVKEKMVWNETELQEALYERGLIHGDENTIKEWMTRNDSSIEDKMKWIVTRVKQDSIRYIGTESSPINHQ